MKYNFDEQIDRSNSDCVKYEVARKATGRTDVIPLWVADMDFRTPPFVLNAISRRLGQGILGYTTPCKGYVESIQWWLKRRYQMEVSAKSIHFIPGIVPGISFAVSCFTNPGDRIMIQPPVYHPFHHVITASGREKVLNPIIERNGRYCMDFEAMERDLPGCKLLILCSPHNPRGIVWQRSELERVAELCHKHHVTVISDEIHADMTFAGHQHIPFATINETARNLSVTFMAPSKAFNMPGVIASHALVYNPELRNRFYTYLDENDLAFGNSFAYDCVKACYSPEGEEWLNEMLQYIEQNTDYVLTFLQTNCPRITCTRPEASFLLFLDNRQLGFPTQKALVDFYIDRAGLYLNDGTMFGTEGTGFLRLNIATPRSILVRAMNQLKKAYDQAGF